MTSMPTAKPASIGTDQLTQLLLQYGCGPIHFTGTDGFYERHLVFDTVKEPAATSQREHFEAVARSIRDVLLQRWVAMETTYQEQYPKRLHYLSLEYLIGRSLSDNITNLLSEPLAKLFSTKAKLYWLDLVKHLADLEPYVCADEQLTALYADQHAWARKAILNVAASGKFSSDRTISQYASEIWKLEPCPVRTDFK